MARFCEGAGPSHESNQFLDAGFGAKQGRSGSVSEDWPVVRISVALVEDVFPGLENVLDFWVCASTPGRFVGDESSVEFAGVSMASEGLGEAAKEFTRSGAKHVVERDFWGIDVGDFESGGGVR